MKKILLSVMSVMLLSVGASAQSLTDIKGFSGLAHAKAQFVNASKGVKAQAAKKIKSNETLIGYEGADDAIGFDGYPGYDISAVGAEIDNTVLDVKKYNGYKVVGLRFAAGASLGENAELFLFAANTDDQSNWAASLGKALTDADYKTSTYEDDGTQITKINTEWNDIYFDDTYTISSLTDVIRYGYAYTQASDKNSDESYPIMIGKTDKNVNGQYIIFGTGQSGQGWYLNSDASNPYTPCIQIIAQDPNGATAIIGVNGETVATAQQYYTLDGKQLSAPQKGLNIVKMSDGTSRKVVVK